MKYIRLGDLLVKSGTITQEKLDEALMKQADAAADDKIDIFLSETDYVNKYTDKAPAIP